MTPDDEQEDDGPATLETTVDASDPRQIRRRETELEIRRREAEVFWRAVFADPVGRREMWNVLEDAHTFQVQFSAGPTGFPDPLATWFQAGEQAYGYRLFLSWMKIDRQGVLTMMAEHEARLQAAPAKSRRKTPPAGR